MIEDNQLVTFLLVEDDDDHSQLITRSFQGNRIMNEVIRVADGAEALEYLFAQGRYQHRKNPDVILLDLNLPKIDGHEVLRRIKSDPNLSVIPVVILTTSSAESDRVSAYQEKANSYVVKPMDFESFQNMSKDLRLFWGLWNQPPERRKH